MRLLREGAGDFLRLCARAVMRALEFQGLGVRV